MLSDDKITKVLWGLIVPFLIISNLQGQNVTKEDYQRAEQFLWSNVDDLVFRDEVTPHWADEQSVFWYRVNTRKGNEFFVVNAEKSTKEPLFDQVKLAEKLSDALGEKVDPYDLPFDQIEWDYVEQVFTFEKNDTTWKVDLNTLDASQARQKEEDKTDQRLLSESPNGKWTVTRKNYDLWLKDNENGKKFQLTKDGTKELIYGSSLPWAWKKQEGPIEKEREPLRLNISWSRDSQKIFAHKLDLRKAKLLYLLQHVPDKGFRVQSHSYHRALPGQDSVAKQIPYVFDVETKEKMRLKIGPYDDLIAGNWNWHGDTNDTLHMLIRERGYGSATLLRANAETGVIDTVFTEVSKTYVDPGKSESEYLPKTDEFLWLSERDGWNHIYLYDLNTGKVKHQVTEGTFVVSNILHVDEKNRKIFFTAGGREPNQDPYLQHLYSVNFDGSDLKLLTPEPATHEIGFSPDFKFFVDTYSRVDLKPTTVLRKASDGSIVKTLEEADIKDLQAIGWQHP